MNSEFSTVKPSRGGRTLAQELFLEVIWGAPVAFFPILFAFVYTSNGLPFWAYLIFLLVYLFLYLAMMMQRTLEGIFICFLLGLPLVLAPSSFDNYSNPLLISLCFSFIISRIRRLMG